jgi:hypothetical protein
MTIRQAEPEDLPAITALLARVFGQCQEFLSPDILQWKFFDSRPGKPGSRSYIVYNDGQVDAHACEWPISFLTPTGDVSSCHVIDWAARPESKGSGIAIYQHLMANNDSVIAIGGSVHARRLLPRLGYEPLATLDKLTMFVRPWRQFRLPSARRGWRDVARQLRNVGWSLQATTTPVRGWSSQPARSVEELPESAYRVRSTLFSMGIRSAEWVQYLLACPLMQCTAFSLIKDGTKCGYFVLNQIEDQCRIIDLAIDSEAPTDWKAAYRTAVVAAIREKATCEVSAVSSLSWLSDALKQIGFQSRGQSPVLAYDPSGKLGKAPPLLLRMTDTDQCFLY